jgi:hypothetical protein
VYDIFATPDDDLALIFPEGTDIAFIEDIERSPNAELVFEALKRTWSNRIPKREAVGITGSCSIRCTASAILPDAAG